MSPIVEKLAFYDSGVLFVFISEQRGLQQTTSSLTKHGTQMFEYFINVVG